MSKRIISYNVNGVRAAMKKGLIDWLKANPTDIFCIQETKAMQEQVDITPFHDLGYTVNWHAAEKKGYSGVATFSKTAPTNVVVGCGIEKYDREGRILRTDYGDWSVLNCYFPSGTSGEERQGFKMDFLADLYGWIDALKKERSKLIILGDYNIAHTEIDIHNPKGNKKTSGFLPEERAWMSQWFESGFTDAFRHHQPETVQYSWWSYRANARANNKGWRIDYHSVTDNLQEHIIEAKHRKDAVHSDHCPVEVLYNL